MSDEELRWAIEDECFPDSTEIENERDPPYVEYMQTVDYRSPHNPKKSPERVNAMQTEMRAKWERIRRGEKRKWVSKQGGRPKIA